MDPSDSACTYINDNNDSVVTNVYFQPQNPQSNGLNEINQSPFIADKSELKKILHTVSLLSESKACRDNPAGNVKRRRKTKRKISTDCAIISDSDEIQIVDVVDLRKNSANGHSVMSSSTRMCSNSSKNSTASEFLKIKDEEDVQITSEVVSINNDCQIVLEDSASEEYMSVRFSATGSAPVNNTVKEADLKNNCLETSTVKDSIETIEIKEKENPNDIAMHDASVDLNSCSETVKDIQIKENENLSDIAICDEFVNLSNCSKPCNAKNTIETIEIKKNEIPSDSIMCEEIVDLSNCPESCNVKDTRETIRIEKNEIPSNDAMCEEIFDLSNCPESCNLKDTIETNGIEKNEIPSEGAMCEEIVDLSNCPETCNVKDTIEANGIEKNEIPSDSGTCGEYVDLTYQTDECSTYDIEYNFNHVPTQITGSWKEFNAGKKNNFTKGCKWAPDGSCILTCSDDNKLRIFNMPSQLWDSSQWCDISELEAVLRIGEGDLIYDYCWYPLMNSNDASTCCLVSTSKKSTVHMWDGYTGELRCSYRSFNHLDELVTPHSLSFDSDGEKLFCGFANGIRVFDVNRPGRLCEERPTYAYKTGQCGIISCFAFTSADKNVSAAGSYKSSIGLYAEPYGELSCLLKGQANGITQLKFSPDGKYLYSGGRKDPEILCWDIRNLGTVLFSLRRSCETNQRIYFDLSKCGKYVVSGNQNGVITFWDITKEPKILNEDDFAVLMPVQFFLAHDDCVNGVSFHPSYPLLCSSSGQRKFPVLMDDDSDAIFSPEIEKQDNSLRLWWIGKIKK